MSAKVTLSQLIKRIKMANMMPLDEYSGGIGNARYFKTKKIKWQIVDIDNTPSSFHPLTQKAKIIDKEGHAYLEMTPPSINEGIVRDSYSEDGLKAGELAEVRPGMESGLDQDAYEQLETAKVLVRRYKTRLLVMQGEALSIGGITINDKGDKLFYDVPSDQKHTFNWSLAATSRIDDLNDMVNIARDKGENPTRFVFGRSTYMSFLNGDDVLEDSTNAGKGKNFTKVTVSEEQRKTGYYRVGTVMLLSGDYDVYVWDDTYKTAAGATAYYFPTTGLTLTETSSTGLVYGAVNVGNDSMKKVEWVAAEFFAKEGEKTGNSDDNPEYKDIFKSSPAVVIPDGRKVSFATVTVA